MLLLVLKIAETTSGNSQTRWHVSESLRGNVRNLKSQTGGLITALMAKCMRDFDAVDGLPSSLSHGHFPWTRSGPSMHELVWKS